MSLFDLFRAHRLRRTPASGHGLFACDFLPKIKPLGTYGL